MGIEWEKFESLQGRLKGCSSLRNECIERAAIILNLDSPMYPKQLSEKIIKIPAFYEYLVFKEIRKECNEKLNIFITSVYDLECKIKNPKYFHMEYKLDKLLQKFNNFIKNQDAFNDYLAFSIAKEKCMEKTKINIESIDDLKSKISSYSSKNKKLNEILQNYDKLIIDKSGINSEKEKWFYAPFTTLMEPIKLIEYKKDGYYQLSNGKFAHDLLTSLRNEGILEFCPDKKYLFEKFDPDKFLSGGIR